MPLRSASTTRRTSASRSYVQVITTTGTRKLAGQIADCLVAERLAACVQVIGPIRSTYRWQGRIEHAQEWLCLIKTQRRRLRSIEARIRSLHSYEVPEILAVPVLTGSRDYLRWLDSEVQ